MPWVKIRRGDVIHVIPQGDFRDHDTDTSCWCEPKMIAPGVCSHNAMYEAMEKGGVKS